MYRKQKLARPTLCNEHSLVYIPLLTTLVSPYTSDSQFSRSALHRLEATGIPVMTSIAGVQKPLAVAIGVQYNSYQSPDIDKILEQWVSGNTSQPPTWRSLYDVLRKLDLEELSEQIDEYLCCELMC